MAIFLFLIYGKNMHYLAWAEISRRIIFENKILRLVLSKQNDNTNKTAEFTLVECPDWATVIALCDMDDGQTGVLMVYQYRVGGQELSLEFPGGMIEAGESDQAAAQRELLEETGYRADEWIKIGDINPNPSFMTNRSHTWLARGLHKVSTQNLDPEELIDVRIVPLADLESGKCPEFEVNAIMLSSWYWFKRWRKSQA